MSTNYDENGERVSPNGTVWTIESDHYRDEREAFHLERLRGMPEHEVREIVANGGGSAPEVCAKRLPLDGPLGIIPLIAARLAIKDAHEKFGRRVKA